MRRCVAAVRREDRSIEAGGIIYPAEAERCIVDGMLWTENPSALLHAGCANCGGWGRVFARHLGDKSRAMFWSEEANRWIRGELASFVCPVCDGRGMRRQDGYVGS